MTSRYETCLNGLTYYDVEVHENKTHYIITITKVGDEKPCIEGIKMLKRKTRNVDQAIRYVLVQYEINR